jgi:cytochrome c oxidase subunit 4
MNSVKQYVQVTGTLLALLLLTVGAAYVHFGAFNTAIAMLISIAKGSLIILFFMHVRQASPLLRVFVCAGFFWLGLMIVLALSDFLTRN